VASPSRNRPSRFQMSAALPALLADPRPDVGLKSWRPTRAGTRSWGISARHWKRRWAIPARRCHPCPLTLLASKPSSLTTRTCSTSTVPLVGEDAQHTARLAAVRAPEDLEPYRCDEYSNSASFLQKQLTVVSYQLSVTSSFNCSLYAVRCLLPLNHFRGKRNDLQELLFRAIRGPPARRRAYPPAREHRPITTAAFSSNRI